MVVGGRELIDTLWNVNFKEVLIIKRLSTRINRYIMECKLVFYDEIKKGEQGINRYIMECKCYDEAKASMIDLGINRYIMECK